MNLKKIIITLGIILLLVGGGIGFWLYSKLNSKSDIISFVPANAELVVYFNFKTIIKNHLFKKSDKQFEKYRNKLKEIPILKNIKDFNETGIDPFGDAVIFLSNHNICLIAKLDNSEKLAQIIQHAQTTFFLPVQSHNNWFNSSSIDGKFEILWNDQLVYLIYPLKGHSKSFSSELMGLKPENGFEKQKAYQLCVNDSLPIWFYSHNNPINRHVPLKGSIKLDSTIKIDAMPLEMEMTYKLSNYDYLDSYSAVFMCDSGNNKINQGVEVLHALAGGIDSDFNLKQFKNKKSLVIYDGQKNISNKMVKYEYDDNFEKKKVELVKTDTINAYAYSSWLKQDRTDAQCQSNYQLCANNLLAIIPEDLIYYIHFNSGFIQTLYPLQFHFDFRFIGYLYQNKPYFHLEIKA